MASALAFKPRRRREWQSDLSEERRRRARERMFSIAKDNALERGLGGAEAARQPAKASRSLRA